MPQANAPEMLRSCGHRRTQCTSTMSMDEKTCEGIHGHDENESGRPGGSARRWRRRGLRGAVGTRTRRGGADAPRAGPHRTGGARHRARLPRARTPQRPGRQPGAAAGLRAGRGRLRPADALGRRRRGARQPRGARRAGVQHVAAAGGPAPGRPHVGAAAPARSRAGRGARRRPAHDVDHRHARRGAGPRRPVHRAAAGGPHRGACRARRADLVRAQPPSRRRCRCTPTRASTA